jgi:hypothetical protein
VHASAEARSPLALFDEVERAREVLVLTYTAALEYLERFALADARSLGALVTVVSDATMVHADPVVVRRAGTQYLDARARCPGGAFHPKLLVIVGDGQARVAIGSGNLTMAGWHANAEVSTVLRADEDGGPRTLRQVSTFLRDLAHSPVALSPGAADALARTAQQLDELPADGEGPTLLHTLHAPIADQLPAVKADDLVLYAPFHDSRLAGTRALLDRLAPSTWTSFVRGDTVVDGPGLEALAVERGGRVAWIATQATVDAGTVVADERYWHGKIVQWREGGVSWAMTGSANLSAPALLRTVAEGGNCELALLVQTDNDLKPAEGPPPPGGIGRLEPPVRDEAQTPTVVFMSATVHDGSVALLLHRPLGADGSLQRYDVDADQWRRSATLSAGSDRYLVELAAAPVGGAVRVLLGDETTSNSVFVTDLARVRRPQIKQIGKARVTPADIARLGLGDQLLADLDELRPHLLRAGATVPPAGVSEGDGGADETDLRGSAIPAARAAPGLTLEDYLAVCDPVLGQRATEFALVLPALPGVGAGLDDTVGTLDSDEDTDTGAESEPNAAEPEPTLADQLRRCTGSERDRYRRFLERLVNRAPDYPMLVRTLATRCVLHALAARLWSEDRWPEVLADALHALGAPGDEPNPYDAAAASALAAVGLGVLRTDVTSMSRLDERTMRYQAAGRAVAGMLSQAPEDKIELLTAELVGRLSGSAGVLAVQYAVEEMLHPLKGAERAAQLLRDEHGFAARVNNGIVIELLDKVAGVAEPRLLLALTLARDGGPIYVRAHNEDGRTVIGAWCEPWLAIERESPAGAVGRAWKLGQGQTPSVLAWDDLPQAACSWFGGRPRPDEIAELLGLIEAPAHPSHRPAAPF